MKRPVSTLTRITLPAVLMSIALAGHAQQPKAEEMQKELGNRFATADANKDGCLTREEASTGIPRISKNFDTIDAEKKGCITLDQLKTTMKDMTGQKPAMKQ